MTHKLRRSENYYTSAANEWAKQLATTKSSLNYLMVKNGSAGTLWLHIFNTAAGGIALLGTRPDFVPVQVATKNTTSIDVGNGRLFTNGIYVALSTTEDTLTAPGPFDGWWEAGWDGAD